MAGYIVFDVAEIMNLKDFQLEKNYYFDRELVNCPDDSARLLFLININYESN